MKSNAARPDVQRGDDDRRHERGRLVRQMRIRLNTFWGLAYGVALVVASSLAAGFGHGTYVPIRVSSAPFGLLGFTAALIGTVVLWTAVGMGFEWLESRGGRNAIRIVLIGHYCSAILLFLTGDLTYLVRGPAALWLVFGAWSLLYGVGQVVVWRSLQEKAR